MALQATLVNSNSQVGISGPRSVMLNRSHPTHQFGAHLLTEGVSEGLQPRGTLADLLDHLAAGTITLIDTRLPTLVLTPAMRTLVIALANPDNAIRDMYLELDVDSGAGDAREPLVGHIGPNFYLLEERIIPRGALAANDVNYATLTLRVDGSALTDTVITTETAGSGGTGNWVAETDFVVGLNPRMLRTGNVDLTLQQTKAAGGVVVPATEVLVRILEVGASV